MGRGSMETVRRDFNVLFDSGSVSGLSDGQLLERFSGRCDDVGRLAFEAVVQRHGPMVLGVCRRVLEDPHAAEDAFQATFLVLACKAGSVRKRESLGPWLHGVAARLARRSRKLRGGRKAGWPLPEGLAAPKGSDEGFADLRGVLDEELVRLPDRYRRPVVLCYLEGKTQEEAARELGWTKGTVSGRLARAKDLLRSRLVRRGLAPTAGLVALGTAEGVVAAPVPMELLGATVRMAASATLGLTEVAPGSRAVAALAQHALRAMLFGKINVAVGLILMLGTFVGAYRVVAASQDRSGLDAKRPVANTAPPVRVEPRQSPLPPGAKVRMGTTRFRQEDMLSHISFSPDGRTLASTGWNGTVCFWDPKTGESASGLEPLKEPNSALFSAYSPDGTLLAVGRDQGVLQVWDLAAHRERFRASVDKGRVQSLAFTPDGRTLASVSAEEPRVRLWDTATGKERRVLKFDDDAVHCGPLAISPDGSRLGLVISPQAAGAASIRIWDLAGGDDPVVIHDLNDSRITTLVFTKDGKTLISGGLRYVQVEGKSGVPKEAKPVGRICVWDVRDGRMIRALESEDMPEVGGFIMSGDRATLVSAHRTKLMIWDLASWRVLRTIPLDPTNSGARDVPMALSPDGRTLAMLRSDHKIHMLNLETGAWLFPEPDAHSDAVLSVAFAPGGRELATSGADGTVRVWDVATGRHVRRLDMGEKGWIWSTGISPDGRFLAAASEYFVPGSPSFHGVARLWDLADGRLVRGWRFDRRAALVVFSSDSRKIAVATSEEDVTAPGGGDKSNGTAIHVFDVGDARASARYPGKVQTRPLAELRGHTARIHAIGFSPDGSSLVSASEDMTFRFWDLATGRPTRQFAIEGHTRTDPYQPGDPTRIIAAAIAPDLKAAVTSGMWDDRLIVWDLAAGKAVRTLRVEKNQGATLAVSPDGRLFASASQTSMNPEGDDDSVRVWDLASGREVHRFETKSHGRRPLAFSPDGTTLAAGLEDTTALVWDLSAPKPTGR